MKKYENLRIASLAFAIYLNVFSGVPSLIAAVQALAVVAMMITAVVGLYTTKLRRVHLTFFELVLYAMSLASLISDLFANNRYIFLYTCAFTCVCLSMSTLCRCMSIKEIFRAAGYAFVAMVVTLGVTQFSELVDALTVSGDLKWLNRFTPLDLHPDLVGVIFGGGSILLGVEALIASHTARIVYAASSIVSIIFVFASSARSSLLCLLFCLGCASISPFSRMRLRNKLLLIAIVVLVIVIFVLRADSVWSYISDMLELESDTRGLGSGGTGRTELWKQGVDLISGRSWELVTGSGLRSSGADEIGFSTENSYITITLESGILLMCLFLTSVTRTILICLTSAWGDMGPVASRLKGISLVLTFLLLESFFNRYLIAIGNPLSLLMLIFNVAVNVEHADRRHLRELSLVRLV